MKEAKEESLVERMGRKGDEREDGGEKERE